MKGPISSHARFVYAALSLQLKRHNGVVDNVLHVYLEKKMPFRLKEKSSRVRWN